ncbi:methyl-accepting chemotaxis protein [Anaerocolumna sp. MB42-C2]|uniref:methyl-accepting chemotaxis protein n=1 Tax=Anaerocolumna sp. MB42-C2 TaxID=3070997 RepID=UPI0027DF16FC|nr:methyl-accepting chemotaxis protein [Anaerocolumna sp. MB42-C2]WMJ85951.1 methyl-accepting chemotaxis protein [Anaerocolumna sp. MB42-C2]
MKWYNNMKISSKLITGFVLVAIIAGIIGVIGIVNIRNMDKLDTELYERHTVTLPELSNITNAYLKQRTSVRNLYIVKDLDARQSYIDDINVQQQKLTDAMEIFKKTIQDASIQENFDILSKALADYKERSEGIISQIQSNNMDKAYELLMDAQGKQISDTIQQSMDKMYELKLELAKQNSDKNSGAAQTSTVMMITIAVVGVLFAVFLGLFISSLISKPIRKMVEVANKLALGDVEVNIDINTKDEIGTLAKAFTGMIENIREQAVTAEKIAAGDLTTDVKIRSENDLLGQKLHEMVENNNQVLAGIASASEQVAVSSKQMSDSSIALSQGATEQASSIEELTASLEEISSQTRLNAENATQANELAVDAKTNAIQGNDQMKDMLNAMEDINESSSNISKIIKVIDEIAFQTNILALNAAVEAARAGQHGKGFAVVAEEVRNLAARSANAAKETTEMIEGSIKKAEGGTRIAKDTALALAKIVDGIEKVAGLVGDIAIASNEQALGIEQINQGIMQVSEVVQTNSATSEESAAAGEELSGQASLLKEMVSKYKLKQNTYNRSDEFNPEIIQMLNNMSNTKKTNPGTAADKVLNADTNKVKIKLSGSDFGKY